MMKMTYYPYEPFLIDDKKITIIETGNRQLYQDLILDFKDLKESVEFSDENHQMVETPKALHWFGDVIQNNDLNKMFQSHICKSIRSEINEQQSQKIFEKAQELKNLVLEATYMLDLPLNVEEQTDFEKIIKFCDIRFEDKLKLSPYGIIETILKTVIELKENKIVGFMNVSDYLTSNELTELSSLVRSLSLKCLIIKFSEMDRRELFDDCRYYYIDSDYVKWS